MAGTSTTDVSTSTTNSEGNIALNVINKQLESLRIKQNHILQIEELISQGKSLNNEQEKVYDSKSIIFDCIKELEMLTDEGKGSVEKVASSHIMFGSIQVPLDGSSMPVLMPVSKPQDANKSKKGSSRMNKNMNKEMLSLVEPLEKNRYLCITDGIVICCLDLKNTKAKKRSPPHEVTKVTSLKLLEMGLPISIGLFKLGSDVYMIGGQEFPSFKKNPNSWGKKLLNDLYSYQSIQGSSCDTYRVSLSNKGLSISKCNNIGPMNMPKFWPIVEKINNQLHVIESLPSELGFYCPDTTPSHEFLDLNDLDRGWTLVSTHPEEKEDEDGEEGEFEFHVCDYIAMDNQIHAKAHRISDQYLVFDSETSKWKVHENEEKEKYHRVFGIDFNTGWGARPFLQGDQPLYVVISVEKETYPVKKQGLMAYLVESKTWSIKERQFLGNIFDGFKQPFVVSRGTLINVDEATICIVLHVNLKEGCRKGYLYVVIFSMKAPAHKWVSGEGFVKVVVKQRYVYNVDECLGADDDIGESVRLSACFF